MSAPLDELRKGIDHIDNPAKLHDFIVRLHQEWDTDIEDAHLTEDQIKSHIIGLIANGHPDAQEMARELTEMDYWNVERWYA